MFKLVLNNTVNSVASKNTSSIGNGLLREFSKLSIYKNSNGSNSNTNNKINNCKCTNCECNCKCTKKTTTQTNIYSSSIKDNINKRYYSTPKQNVDDNNNNIEDNKIGYVTSESNKSKILENLFKDSKTKEDYIEKFKKESTSKKQDPADVFKVKGAVPRPEIDEHYEKPFLVDDLADDYFNKQLPNSNREDEILPFSDNTRFRPFKPVRPRTQESSVVNGASSGYSKRKRSRAVATVKPGNGEILVNGRTILDYFPSLSYRDNVLQPLVITETLTKWNIQIRAFGGGLKGQSEAARRALGLALVNYDLGYRPALKVSDLLKSDNRKVERKKPGQLKARKKFPLVKR
ncbi:hypothetical protein ACTA71_003577 [Dictyostelium dimigraforme]